MSDTPFRLKGDVSTLLVQQSDDLQICPCCDMVIGECECEDQDDEDEFGDLD